MAWNISSRASDLPHTCGDEPLYTAGGELKIAIYPTHVGMNRSLTDMNGMFINLPHTCGDEPTAVADSSGQALSTPHMWG